MLRYFFLIYLSLCALPVLSQEVKSLIDRGDKAFSVNDYKKALEYYYNAESKDPNNSKIKLKIGQSHLSMGAEAKALPFLEEAYQKDPNVDAYIEYYLGLAYQASLNFSKAIEFFEKFKSKNSRYESVSTVKIEECVVGDSLKNKPVLCEIKLLDMPVNSPYQDYGPILNEKNDMLIFTSARDTTQKDTKNNILFEDVMISRLENGKWSSPKNFAPKVNNSLHDAATYLTPDGDTVYLYYETGNGDLYKSIFNGDEWTFSESIGTKINSESWETSGSLSADRKKFYFASNRPGGQGGLDIYVSTKQPNGEWGDPVNLGPRINTAGNEDAPIIHADGTLYFGSDGHIGMGDYDIYKATMQNGVWQEPINMGYPINTPKFENYFFMCSDNKTAYFSSIRNEGMGKSDIYFIRFLDPPPKPVQGKTEPTPTQQQKNEKGAVTRLSGKVIDSETAKPLKAMITLVDNKGNRVVERIYSDETTGDFTIDIPHGGNYGINTTLIGYLFNSMNFEVPAFEKFQEVETAIIMQKAEVGSKMVLKNIFFDEGQATLKNESISELESILNLLERNAELKLQINGHTDSSGDATTNKALSLKRADAVKTFLIQRGITPGRLRTVGFGEERPIVSNDDESGGREINRRTELEVTEAHKSDSK